MTVIESGIVNINQTPETVYDFLADCNNHQRLMPDQVINWQSTADECSFTIKGTADLSLRIADKRPGSYVLLEPHGRIPFEFMLKWEITPNGSQSSVKARLEADLNMFLKMVAAKPLENFLIHQANTLQTILNGQANL